MNTRRNAKQKYGQIKHNPDEYFRTPRRRLFGVSGYLLFSSAKREDVKPDKITVTELGNMWTNLNEKEKEKYNKKAEKLRNAIYEAYDKLNERKEKEKTFYDDNIKEFSKSNKERKKIPAYLDIDYRDELNDDIKKDHQNEKKNKKDLFLQKKKEEKELKDEQISELNALEISPGSIDNKDYKKKIENNKKRKVLDKSQYQQRKYDNMSNDENTDESINHKNREKNIVESEEENESKNELNSNRDFINKNSSKQKVRLRKDGKIDKRNFEGKTEGHKDSDDVEVIDGYSKFSNGKKEQIIEENRKLDNQEEN